MNSLRKNIISKHKIKHRRFSCALFFKMYHGHRNAKDLWAGDEQLHIEYMVALYNSFDEDSKPQWLTLDEIYELKELMCDNAYK